MTDEDRARIPQEVAAMGRRDGGAVGWWHPAGEQTFRGIAIELVALGVPVDRALSILESAYGAVANEYGG